MTAAAAAAGIRQVDPTGSIGIISAERDAPYSRPPLSKGLWKGDSPKSVWCKMPGHRVELHLSTRITIAEAIPEKHDVSLPAMAQ